ncbi:NADPH:quinone reductase [Vineibacter terrae]|nr:NADPH:quinone reductase [Vineibacter terrae]
MKAAWYERNGPALAVIEVGEMPDPVPGRGEVLVRIRASAVNPSDVKSRAGLRSKMSVPRQIPHSDAAGEIVDVGADVPRSRIGERVWTWNAAYGRWNGTAAQLCTLPAEMAVPLPAMLDFAQGACLAIPLLTAHRCLFADGPPTGETVLVSGGAGVVGHYAVQLARWAGAQVIATVSGPQKAAHAAAAGAHAVINYRTEDVAARVAQLTGGAGVDRIIEVELGENLDMDLGMLRDQGVLVYYGSKTPAAQLPFFRSILKNVLIRPVLMYTITPAQRDQAIRDIGRWLADRGLAGADNPGGAVRDRPALPAGRHRRRPCLRRGRNQDRPRRRRHRLSWHRCRRTHQRSDCAAHCSIPAASMRPDRRAISCPLRRRSSVGML